jgi:hypothetical protein
MPISFEHTIYTTEGRQRFKVVVDPSSEKITVIFGNRNVKIYPEIVSSSYSINIIR